MVLDGKSSQEYPVNAGVPQESILGPTRYLLYINDLSNDVIFNIAIYADDTTLYPKCDQAFNFASEGWLLVRSEKSVINGSNDKGSFYARVLPCCKRNVKILFKIYISSTELSHFSYNIVTLFHESFL